MSWLDITPLLKQDKTGDRDLELYPRCNFFSIYLKFDENKIDPYGSKYLRREWKTLVLKWDKVNRLIWDLAKIRRRGIRSQSVIKRMHRIVFNLLQETKYLYSMHISLVNQTSPIWQNLILNIIRSSGFHKDEIYEVLPYTHIENLKLLFRQIFDPLVRILSEIEGKLLNEEVDEEKLKILEEMMLLNVLPFFENVFKKVIDRQEEGIW